MWYMSEGVVPHVRAVTPAECVAPGKAKLTFIPQTTHSCPNMPPAKGAGEAFRAHRTRDSKAMTPTCIVRLTSLSVAISVEEVTLNTPHTLAHMV